MADIAKLLKDEITRLARKEVKKNVVPLRTKLISLSRTVSRQQKALDSLEKTIARQNKLLAEAPALSEAVSEEAVKKSRVSPRLVKIQRKRLKLNQSDFARLLCVSVATVRSWEQGRSQPRRSNLAAFVSVRRLKLTAARERLGITSVRKRRGRPKKRGRRKKKS